MSDEEESTVRRSSRRQPRASRVDEKKKNALEVIKNARQTGQRVRQDVSYLLHLSLISKNSLLQVENLVEDLYEYVPEEEYNQRTAFCEDDGKT